MISGFSVSHGLPSVTYSTEAYNSDLSDELLAIGQLFAQEDYCANGPERPGYDLVKVRYTS